MPLFTRQLPLPARILSSIHLFTRFTERSISTTLKPANLRRSYLYVPASSDRMLEKSITTGSDVIIYDLEDSVSPVPLDKANARVRLKKFLGVRTYFIQISNLKMASV
jgi:malate synthase